MQVDYNFDLDDKSDLERDGCVNNSKYYDIADFNSLAIDYDSSFSVCHINIASLSKQIDDLRQVISQLKSPLMLSVFLNIKLINLLTL